MPLIIDTKCLILRTAYYTVYGWASLSTNVSEQCVNLDWVD
jgi:hypothetical protein